MTGFGPLVDGDQVVFRLWAPGAAGITVELERGEGVPLAPADDGWQEARAAGGPGLRYRFRMGDTVFPDPASRQQTGGVHGWSVVRENFTADPQWQGRAWEETVLYECHPGLMGGFDGVADKLPALAALGITAVELMPIAAFPGARNWGYDGVLPFAPAEAYGTPEQLKALIACAHDLNLMVFLDVVYNHFGPDGNYLPLYAQPFFRTDTPTPWGAAIDFRVPQVQDFFTQNARQWLFEYGFDGLRFDAVHAIADEGWLDRLALELRREAGSRQIHLVLENDDNIASHLRPDGTRPRFDAQWNDDIHHAFHVLLTGERQGYYQDYAEHPAEKLARGLAQGFIYQGDASLNRGGAARGEPSADLPPSAFVAFLQNHDQTGNRALGERLTTLAPRAALEAAVALLLLSPQIPLIFMGEEKGSRAPFAYFTDHGPELAQAVREGRAREFAAFVEHAGSAGLPDPNAVETFAAADPDSDAPDAQQWQSLYRELLDMRRTRIVPHLHDTHSVGANAIGDAAVRACWKLGAGGVLTIATNFGDQPVEADLPRQGLIWGPAGRADIPPATTLAWITT